MILSEINNKLKFSRLRISGTIPAVGGYYHFHVWGKTSNPGSNFPDIVEDQYRELSDFYQSNGYPLQILNQVHGCGLVRPASTQVDSRPEADAICNADEKKALCIKTADCVPIFFYSGKNLFFGIIHAGWRGLDQGILKATLDGVRDYAQTQDLRFIVGPHIHAASYETSIDVYSRFENACSIPSNQPEKRYLDMAKILEKQFSDYGIPAENISWLNENTFGSERFFSHRSGEMGRNFNVMLFSKIR